MSFRELRILLSSCLGEVSRDGVNNTSFGRSRQQSTMNVIVLKLLLLFLMIVGVLVAGLLPLKVPWDFVTSKSNHECFH